MIGAIRVGPLGKWETIKLCPGDDHDYRFTHETDNGRFRHYICRRCCDPRRVDFSEWDPA